MGCLSLGTALPYYAAFFNYAACKLTPPQGVMGSLISRGFKQQPLNLAELSLHAA
jgi:hypothetical protein